VESKQQCSSVTTQMPSCQGLKFYVPAMPVTTCNGVE